MEVFKKSRPVFLVGMLCCLLNGVLCGNNEGRQAAWKANQFVGELVAARCPSQMRKVKSFLVADPDQHDGGKITEKAIELGEHKALEMADQLCEGAVDDKGVKTYTQIKFHYADVNSLVGELQSAAKVKLAEEQAMIAAEHVFHQSLIQQGQEEQSRHQQQEAARVMQTQASADELDVGKTDSQLSVIVIAVFVLLIGGGVGIAVALTIMKRQGLIDSKDISLEHAKSRLNELLKRKPANLGSKLAEVTSNFSNDMARAAV